MLNPKLKMLINGEEIDSSVNEEIRNPYNNEIVGMVSVGSEKNMKDAIEAATRAFETTRFLPTYRRVQVLHKLVDLIKQKRDVFSNLMTRESGKPIQYTRAEVDRSILTFTLAAEEASRVNGDAFSLDLASHSEKRSGIVRRFPIGPIAAISPYNFPLNLIAHKVGPMLATGNTMVLKPPPQCPLTGLILANLVKEAGAVSGQLNVLHCPIPVAEMMVKDERIKMINFTGSSKVGWYLKSISGKKKVLLELGGNAGVVIDKGVNLEWMIKRIAIGAYANAGQICIKVQRIFVQQDLYHEFENQFISETRKLKVGDPLDEDTVVGPMIDEANAERAHEWIQESLKQGATIVAGGNRKKSFLEPTILKNVTKGMKVLDEEVFAPIVTIDHFTTFSEACEKVNDSCFGLQAGVFTNDLRNAFYAFEKLDVGGVIINDYPTYRIDNMPYGGIKDSGFGREGVKYAIQEMTEPKLMVLNLSN